MSNARAILIRIPRRFHDHKQLMEPIASLPPDSVDERMELAARLRDYLAEPPLPDG
jgi:hypothetical protein